MGVGMGSNKKSNGGGSVVVWFVVLGLALLVDAAAAKWEQGGTAVHLPGWYCQERCRGKEDYLYCVRRCMFSPSSGAALRLASHRGTGEEETRGGGGVGLQVDGAGREEKGKKKQEEEAPVHLPGWVCEYQCERQFGTSSDAYIACVRDCYPPSGNGLCQGQKKKQEEEEEELVSWYTERAGHGEEEEKRKQEDAAVHLQANGPDNCYHLCIRKKGPEFPECMNSCVGKVI